jgi:ATP-dependent RNA helicase DDX54/DBP10
VTSDELPFMLDLQLFTGRPLVFASSFKDNTHTPSYTTELVYGLLPQSEVGLEAESFAAGMKGDVGLNSLRDSAQNAYKMYLRSRPMATKAAYARSKEVLLQYIGLHPFFGTFVLHKLVKLTRARRSA